MWNNFRRPNDPVPVTRVPASLVPNVLEPDKSSAAIPQQPEPSHPPLSSEAQQAIAAIRTKMTQPTMKHGYPHDYEEFRDPRVEHPKIQTEYWSVRVPGDLYRQIAFRNLQVEGPTIPVPPGFWERLLELAAPETRLIENQMGDGLLSTRIGWAEVIYERVPKSRMGRVIWVWYVHRVESSPIDDPDLSIPVLPEYDYLPMAEPEFMVSDNAQLSELCVTVDIADRVHEVLNAVTPSIAMTVTDWVDGGSRSRLGGLPDLSPQTPWPVDAQGSLTFLAQVDLSETRGFPAAVDLPDEGLLSFFWNERTDEPEASDSGSYLPQLGVRVIYQPTSQTTQPQSLPDDLARRSSTADGRWRFFPARGVQFFPILTLPEDFVVEEDPDSDLDHEESIIELAQALGMGQRLLGAPLPIHGGVAESLERGDPGPWRLLAQFGSAEPFTAQFEGYTAWGAGGLCYFMIRADDLRQRNFDRTVLVFHQ